MKGITLDLFTNRIVVSRACAKKVKNTNSQEYNELKKIVAAYPGFEVTVREKIQKSNAERYPGLNDKYIRDYIEKYSGNPVKYMADYEKVVFLAECRKYKFGYIRKWFLETFPEVKEDFRNKAAEREENAKSADNADAVSKAA